MMTTIQYELFSSTVTKNTTTVGNYINDITTSAPDIKAYDLITQPWSVILACFLFIFVILTVSGNFLVILAVVRERYLRTITNYFIVSLAVADLLMGTIVMPFAVFHEVANGFWPFGALWCDLWHAFDVLSSTASILNLCMIALERYWATQYPLNYNTIMTRNRCLLMILTVWVCSSSISFPAIIWWRYSSNKSSSSSDATCQFTDDRVYLIISSVVSFYGPLVIMVIVYARIYRTATNMVKSFNEGTKVVYRSTAAGNSINREEQLMVLRIHRGGVPDRIINESENNALRSPNINNKFSSSSSRYSSEFPTGIVQNCEAKVSLHLTNPVISSSDEESNCQYSEDPEQYQYYNSSNNNEQFNMTVDESLVNTGVNGKTNSTGHPYYHYNKISRPDSVSTTKRIARNLQRFAVSKRIGKFTRDQKAAKTLGIVMGIFIICWLPFFLFNLIHAATGMLSSGNVSIQKCMVVVTWLGYSNSGINPLIYAHSMKDFRRAFINILCCCCNARRTLGSTTGGSSYLPDEAQVRAAVLAIASSGSVQPRSNDRKKCYLPTAIM